MTCEIREDTTGRRRDVARHACRPLSAHPRFDPLDHLRRNAVFLKLGQDTGLYLVRHEAVALDTNAKLAKNAEAIAKNAEAHDSKVGSAIKVFEESRNTATELLKSSQKLLQKGRSRLENE